ncbi:MAG: phenylalanine--tRNA ligase subunit beta [Burkholderiales bacterium]|nr:phenylalanine--tRNA ligase subunit beta [Burkholderiales bacterium]
MKISENWLRTLVDPRISRDELAHQLTMSGIEVEGIAPVAPHFEKVVVAKVLSVEKHPDADRLNVCSVDAGLPEPLQIVCGAPNVAQGVIVPCALIGAVLPGIEIREAKVRGVKSFGMLCSAKELGIEPALDGLLLLPNDAPVGMDFRKYHDLDDTVFELKLTPNRADCLSVLGVAREISAMTGAPIARPEGSNVESACQDRVEVTVDVPHACPLYLGRVIRGVNMAFPTPEWMARRLVRSGIRTRNIAVDVTNYVMLELGQPLHAYDLDKLSGGISVRFARESENILLLNGENLELSQKQLVISDAQGAIALAGIMGGEGSSVSDSTRDIFLEAAFFDPAVMAKARVPNLSTDASYRFERGVDFGMTRKAMERATELILVMAGGAAGPVSGEGAALPERNPIRLRLARAKRILGIDLAMDSVAALLERLAIDFSIEGEVFSVVPPSYRFDLKIEEDLVEEVARLHGYDNITGVRPASVMTMLPAPESEREVSVLRKLMVGRGYFEAISYAFVDVSWEADFCANQNPIALRNPIASQMSVMRGSLLGGLVDCLNFNLNRKQSRIRVFETGACFHRLESGYGQKEMLAGLCYGSALPEQWGTATRSVDFFDVKSDIEALFSPFDIAFEAAIHPALHPGRSAAVFLDGDRVGVVGELHPKWVQKYDLPKAPVLFEIELDALSKREIPAFTEISKFPPVRRDLAVVVEEKICAQAVLDVCRSVLRGQKVELFDVYRGQGVETGRKSLAFGITMQDAQKTLLDAEVDAMILQLIEALEKRFDSKLRV